MGNEQVKVNLGSLDQMISELASFDTEIEQQIAALESRVASLHTRWEGDGAAMHAQAQAEWAKGAQLLSDGRTWPVASSSDKRHMFDPRWFRATRASCLVCVTTWS
ncbi:MULTISPECIES: WXG100 family type VII secretion target [Mycolicibacterium]|uniref:WXG100 family type VII secretion target n=1 Tax=Mycolicibacterium porcinum TaxID=39693 RepID=A0ABV3VBS0_9MYCO|nr:WXG100 family type VII secretion target [Mycolicibacterium fortuitum]